MNINIVDEYNEGGHLLYSDNYIGAFARGRTRAEALQKIPAEVECYCRWLGREADRSECQISVVQEKISPLQICDADSDVLFKSELPPLTWEEYGGLRALALKSARDFLRLYQSIPDKDKTVLTPRKTFYGDVPITAREMYEHTKNVNTYYFGEIGVPATNEPDIEACRLRGFETLEQQPGFLDNAVYDGSYNEAWSLRKVCRRFIWHDRIHARAMYKMAMRLCGKVENPFFFAR
ncbi:MAG: hypothetical protein VB055_08655 [Oscillospiraceae bacterium]|nr:hypothetical protein [Oscillospiraceae bacterium]